MDAVEAWMENDQGGWLLNINHVASEQDLQENHYLEEVGQPTEHVAINILFCPYCGEKVDKISAEITPFFTHNDYSKW